MLLFGEDKVVECNRAAKQLKLVGSGGMLPQEFFENGVLSDGFWSIFSVII